MEAGNDLAEDGGDEAAGEGSALASLDELEEVALHGLEDEVELLCLWEEEGIVEGDDVRMDGYRAEGL